MRRSLLVTIVAGCGVVLAGTLVEAAEKAGKKTTAGPSSADGDARQNVHQALLAESRGDNAQRSRRLAAALLVAPDLPEANWHTARVLVEGKWLPLVKVNSQAASDPDLPRYRELRDKAANDPKALRDLARWCKKQGWPDIARLHYAQLLDNPSADDEMRKEAVKELDLHQVDNVWVTGKVLQASQAQRAAIDAALKKWRPRLKKLQEAIDGENYDRRDKAIKELQQINDPQVIAVLE